MELLRPSLPATIDIRIAINTEHDQTYANPTEIHQVLMNLCTNAGHAMRENGGILDVRLDDNFGPIVGWSETPKLQDMEYLVLTVADTGYGIEPAFLTRIFDPFFTTKKQGEGTGMGLAVVHGIVQGCGGAISVESSPGKGATFRVYFPKSKPGSVHNVDLSTREAAVAARHNLKVLFVDDEPMITSMAGAMFEMLGLRAFCMTDSLAALHLFSSDPEEFDIVVTDQTMPGLTGAELSKRLLLLKPSLPIILCTGYSDIMSAEMAKQMGVSEYFTKPVDFNRLNRTIIRLVNEVHSRLN
jgi:CheY-like chemotaxis protein